MMMFCLYMYDLMSFILKPDVGEEKPIFNFWQHVNKTLALFEFCLVFPCTRFRLSLGAVTGDLISECAVVTPYALNYHVQLTLE